MFPQTDPEWTFRDIDSTPGHHDCVFNGLARGVAAAVGPITVILNLHINWVSISVLRVKKKKIILLFSIVL